jgi:hypothetical protein
MERRDGPGEARNRRERPKCRRNTASNIDEQSDSASNIELKTESDIPPDQTPIVRVLLYCFKPPEPRAAASPPPRRAEGARLGIWSPLIASLWIRLSVLVVHDPSQ